MSKFQSNMLTIIVVEDDPMVRKINEGFIDKVKDYKIVGSFGKLEDAKIFLKNNEPDLILLDIFFPNEQGTDLLRWIRKNQIHSDVICITADNSAETIEETRRYGAFDYLLKPFRFERLEEALTRFKEMKMRLNTSDTFDQESLDDLFESKEDEKRISSLDASFNRETNKTYQGILRFLQDNPNEFFTSNMIGEKLGVSRITARRYLDQMEQEDLLIVEPNYGSVGRPQNYYKLRS
jgi:response regulator of citrate/malate metabolism